jgi:hypothetical protein
MWKISIIKQLENKEKNLCKFKVNYLKIKLQNKQKKSKKDNKWKLKEKKEL